MISIILSGHGNFSTGVLEASQMIFGEQDQLVAVPFLKGEGIQNLQSKYQKALDHFPEENEVLFLVDIFGGTPYNAAVQLVAGKKSVDVASGVSLPILLEALGNREYVSLEELVEQLKEVNKTSFQTLSEQLAKMSTTNSEEENEL